MSVRLRGKTLFRRVAAANVLHDEEISVGYGKSKPKDPSAPMDPANRRVQVVNLANKTASQ